MSTWSDRLNECIKENKISHNKLAQICGVSLPAFKKWVSGQTVQIDAVYAIRLAEVFHINVAWLITGEGPKRGSNILAVNDEQTLDDSQYIYIKESKVIFSAGSGYEPTYEEVADGTKTAYKLSWFKSRGLNPKNCMRFKVHGDSMYPFICDGDMITVDVSDNKTIKANKVYCIAVEGAMRVKRLIKLTTGGLLIKSDNSEYPTETLSAEDAERFVIIIGRVVDRSGDKNF